ncbi:MAG: hypothetical protein COC19_02575 [SAR86 cluster bacterium]|uniref:AsmA domain-containing protein n=1 Tax=SAR86 cluster bacterium TaxID=2030880 RepID=A0A2A4MRQ6_9GAMM|nr:MAG: hypothetical protein COC19_02575 [SAR86 cluster bacterium]
MLKKLLISVVVIVAAIGIGGYFYMGSLLAKGIETVGSEVLGTEVKVASVSLSPLSGSGSITGLIIDNLEGFSADTIMELGELSIEVDIASVFTDTIVVNSIVINQPQITYEARLSGSNLSALLDRLSSSETESSASEDADGAGKSIIIRDLVIDGARVNLVSALASAPIPLPRLHLQDIGEPGDSVSMVEAGKRVIAAISSSILEVGLPDIDLEGLRDSARERLDEGVESARDALNNATDGILDSGVGNAVENLSDRLRGLGR